MTRWLSGWLAGVVGAALVGLSLACLLAAQGRAAPPSDANAGEPALRGLLESYLALEGERVHALCAHDVRVERLGLELTSLGAELGDASATARSLAKSHGEEIWLLHQRANNELRLLGSSLHGPGVVPSAETLNRALTTPLALGGAQTKLGLACRRPLGRDALWIVKALDPAALAAVSPGLTWAPAAPSTRPALLRFAGSEGTDDLSVTPYVEPSKRHEPLALMLGLVMGAGCLAGLLGWLLTRARPSEEAALAEIERAAARVAEGDLTSTIDMRVGGKADQTFRSFDRMTRELREMRARLAEAERAAAFQEIARRIAHEIKNPLAPIQMAMETLRKAHAKRLDGFDEIFDESTRAVLEEVRRMERIVCEFSEFARLPKAQPGALALDALVDEVAQLYRPPDVQLDIAREAPLPDVRVDREQITQVLVNLLQNAFDAARANKPQDARVRVRVYLREGRVALDVEDNGPGVAESERARIFEPYVTSKAHGTGLGLAIVKRILSDHGADIEVGSSALGGARFSLTFASASTRGS